MMTRRGLTASQPGCADKLPRVPWAEFGDPTPNRFIGQVESTLGEQILHVAIAQGKAQIEPHRVLDDRWRKLMPGVRD
jgi:hypothetical protein